MSTITQPPSGDVTLAAWAPLRIATYRNLWLAVLGADIGTWMQTVGAQWLLVDEPNASTLVALVQTAGMLPISCCSPCLPAPSPTVSTGGTCSSAYSASSPRSAWR